MRRFAFVFALLIGVPCWAQAPAPAVPDAGWTRTVEGCFVWNKRPAAEETVSWSGACEGRRATGSGTLVWRIGPKANGVYLGEMKLGHLNGHGMFIFANGDRYEGLFRDDALNGFGELKMANGNSYKGEFRNFRMEGRGTFSFQSGDRYEGGFANDMPNGTGRVTWKNGERYEGGIRNGLPDGQGTYTAASQAYTGTWAMGCFKDGNRRKALMVPEDSCK